MKSLASSKFRRLILVGGLVTAGLIGFSIPVHASELIAHGGKLPWSHDGMLSAFDHASLRRGYQVYKEVCAACHSLNFICYRHLVDTILTEEEAKSDAAEVHMNLIFYDNLF